MDVNNPHDSLFKEAFSDKNINNVIDLIKNTLPNDITNDIDYSTIDVSKDTFIDEVFKDSQSDVLVNAKFKKSNVKIYFLYEHKSFLDKYTIFQMLKYMLRIWDKDKIDKKSSFTPIIPVIFYHGKKDWNYNTNFVSYFDVSKLNDTLVKYLPNFNCELFNLPEVQTMKSMEMPISKQ